MVLMHRLHQCAQHVYGSVADPIVSTLQGLGNLPANLNKHDCQTKSTVEQIRLSNKDNCHLRQLLNKDDHWTKTTVEQRQLFNTANCWTKTTVKHKRLLSKDDCWRRTTVSRRIACGKYAQNQPNSKTGVIESRIFFEKLKIPGVSFVYCPLGIYHLYRQKILRERHFLYLFFFLALFIIEYTRWKKSNENE